MTETSEHAYLYSIPYAFYEKDRMRRYGFHGTSHRYVSLRAAELLGKRPEELKLVSCHLGNGASLAAIDCGRCVDTSMGMTPLAGLTMGTRAGDMDAGVVEYIANKYSMTVSETATTMASSTTVPITNTKANRVIRLILNPAMDIKANVPITTA